MTARDDLLARTIAYYAEHGVRDTSLRTLATEIGTSQRMLHYHFGDREALLAAVVEQLAADETAALDELVGGTDDVFDALTRFWVRVRDDARIFGPLFFELSTHAMHGRAYADGLAATLVTGYAAAFGRAYASMTDEPHAARLARLTLGVGRGVLFDMLLDGDVGAADAAVAEFTALVRRRLGR